MGLAAGKLRRVGFPLLPGVFFSYIKTGRLLKVSNETLAEPRPVKPPCSARRRLVVINPNFNKHKMCLFKKAGNAYRQKEKQWSNCGNLQMIVFMISPKRKRDDQRPARPRLSK
jgi:hypothetical protein